MIGGATVKDDGSVRFDLQKQAIGCYEATLFTPDAVKINGQVTILPSPTIKKATRTGNTVTLEGSELLALNDADCSLAQVSIKVLDDKGVESTTKATNVSTVDQNGAQATFAFAIPAGNATL